MYALSKHGFQYPLPLLTTKLVLTQISGSQCMDLEVTVYKMGLPNGGSLFSPGVELDYKDLLQYMVMTFRAIFYSISSLKNESCHNARFVVTGGTVVVVMTTYNTARDEKSGILGFNARCFSLQWRHNERGGVTNHQPHDCLLNVLFRC